MGVYLLLAGPECAFIGGIVTLVGGVATFVAGIPEDVQYNEFKASLAKCVSDCEDFNLSLEFYTKYVNLSVASKSVVNWNGYINRYVDTEDCRFRVNVNTDFKPTPLDYLQLK